MPRRATQPPLTLWLYILADMWRLLLLTTGVLVTVIAFAAAVKPLADGKLGPIDCIRFMLFAMPPMLQYALPFAACFAATLTYYRLASDNEITACHAGGISHRSLLAPTLGSGLALLVVLLVLSNFVIPRFLRSMAEMITQDAARLLVKSIEDGQAVRLGDTLVYADEVRRLGPDPAGDAYQRLWLGGVLVVVRSGTGEITSQGTAREAYIWLRRHAGDAESEPATQVVMRPIDFVGTGEGARMEGTDAVRVFTIPNAFSDDPKFLSFGDLARLRREPERMNWIDKRRMDLAFALSQRHAVESIKASLTSTGRVEFDDFSGQKHVLYAADIRFNREERPWLRIIPLRQAGSGVEGRAEPHAIVIDTTYPDGRVQRRQANLAGLRFVSASTMRDPSLASIEDSAPGLSITMRLLDVAAQNLPPEDDDFVPPAEEASAADEPDAAAPPVSPAPPIAGAIGEWKLTGLRPVDDQTAVLSKIDARGLLEISQARMDAKPEERGILGQPFAELSKWVSSLMREILSKVHERLAVAAACLVMVLIGAVMAMRLRDSLPLTIYLWAFFPALGATITISAGQQLTYQRGAVGLLLLWGGVAALAAYGVVEFRKLAKH